MNISRRLIKMNLFSMSNQKLSLSNKFISRNLLRSSVSIKHFSNVKTNRFIRNLHSQRFSNTKEEQNTNKEEEQEEEEYYDDEFETNDEVQKSSFPWKTSIFFLILSSLYYYYDKYVYRDTDEPLFKILFGKYLGFLYKPTIETFLPDEMPLHPSIKPRTLIISFENLLYHKNYEAGSGIILDLRPGLRKFLKDLSQFYEIILYSDEESQFMDEVIGSIDPNHQFLKFSFGRECFAMHKGKYMKDYDYFNRDFKDVVIVDFDDKINYNRKENIVLVKPYKGEDYDNTLSVLSKFLIRCRNADDVRTVIKQYGGYDAVKNFESKIQEKVKKTQEKRGWIQRFFGKKN